MTRRESARRREARRRKRRYLNPDPEMLSRMASVSQRWTDGTATYRSNATDFDPSRYEVRKIKKKDAISFSNNNHYLGGVGQWTCGAGLYDTTSKALVGIATFSNPARLSGYGRVTQHGRVVIQPIPKRNMATLARFVLTDAVPGNGETWFLPRATKIARAHYEKRGNILQLLISFSDPVIRRNAKGHAYMPGHIGNIYQAANATYLRPSRSKPLYMSTGEGGRAAGRSPESRSLSKINSLDTTYEHGAESSAENLIRSFYKPALERRSGEEFWAWSARLKRSMRVTTWMDIVKKILADGDYFAKIKHPGNLTYFWTFGINFADRDWRERTGWKKPGDCVHRLTTKQRKRDAADLKNRILSEFMEHTIPWENVIRLLMGDRPTQLISYPKKRRQAYISLSRKYDIAWSKGNLKKATETAEAMLLVWNLMSREERAPHRPGALLPPPTLREASQCLLGPAPATPQWSAQIHRSGEPFAVRRLTRRDRASTELARDHYASYLKLGKLYSALGMPYPPYPQAKLEADMRTVLGLAQPDQLHQGASNRSQGFTLDQLLSASICRI